VFCQGKSAAGADGEPPAISYTRATLRYSAVSVIDDPFFYALAVPALLVHGISKGGFGAGLGILVVPMLALVISPARAAAILLPVLMLQDIYGVVMFRNRWDPRNLRIMLPAGVLGIALGALSFRAMSDRVLELMVGSIAVGFALQTWFGLASRQAPRAPDWRRGGFWSAVSGFTSFIANSGGAPISVYLLPQRLDPTIYVGTTVMFFAAINLLKVGPYFWLGLLNSSNLLTSAVLLPLGPIGMGLGLALNKRLDPVLFYRVCYAILFLAGGKLMFDGLFSKGGFFG
jgi:uncharacterized protein